TFPKYLPDQEIAEKYTVARDESNRVWDFGISCSEKMKQQIFRAICSLSREKKSSWERNMSLTGLRCLYQFCVRAGIDDIEQMELEEKERFAQELRRLRRSEKSRKSMFGILAWIQRHEFLSAKEIHWQANVWYLERIHIAGERINESNHEGCLIFEDVEKRENREQIGR